MRIGVDLGGTKIEALALGPGGRELARQRTATPRDDYDAIVRAIAGLVEAVESQGGGRGSVGVGIPGTISPATGRIKNANTVCLIGHRLDRDLEAALGRPVRLANDANCFALSEAADGAAAGAETVFGAILGTGCGGGLVVHGREIRGRNAIAGEWGHNPLPWQDVEEYPGRRCYCGKLGCLETFLSGPGLVADHRTRHPECTLSAPEIFAAAEAGERAAEETILRYERRLAKSLATVLNLFDPDIVVLGGGLSNNPRLYENVPRLWQDWAFSDVVTTELAKARHGDSSGVRGAAWLWPESAEG
ncbi:MAG: ROK family protein [Alphaproteobacteria bacterium]|nr:ROK family protein [Alphaproteobacteria bacterium]